MSWNRKLWGVEFTSPNNKPWLLGCLWMMETQGRKYYDGEPTRPILFTTRAKAREWCREKQVSCRMRDDSMAKWSFRPVRVRETVVKL